MDVFPGEFAHPICKLDGKRGGLVGCLEISSPSSRNFRIRQPRSRSRYVETLDQPLANFGLTGADLSESSLAIDEEQDDGFDVRLLHRSLRAAANKKTHWPRADSGCRSGSVSAYFFTHGFSFFSRSMSSVSSKSSCEHHCMVFLSSEGKTETSASKYSFAVFFLLVQGLEINF